VDYADQMGGVRGACQRPDDPRGILRRLRPVQAARQTAAVDVFQRDEWAGVRLARHGFDRADLENLDDVRMLEHRDRGRLGLEPYAELRIGQRFAAQRLERHPAVQVPVPCLVDDPHAAPADHGQDFVAAHAGKTRIDGGPARLHPKREGRRQMFVVARNVEAFSGRIHGRAVRIAGEKGKRPQASPGQAGSNLHEEWVTFAGNANIDFTPYAPIVRSPRCRHHSCDAASRTSADVADGGRAVPSSFGDSGPARMTTVSSQHKFSPAATERGSFAPCFTISIPRLRPNPRIAP
jgi:hypothetical protein